MLTPLQRTLLCAPVPTLGLPALIQPKEHELWQREIELAWHPDEGTGELLATLRVLGTIVILERELKELELGRPNAS